MFVVVFVCVFIVSYSRFSYVSVAHASPESRLCVGRRRIFPDSDFLHASCESCLCAGRRRLFYGVHTN